MSRKFIDLNLNISAQRLCSAFLDGAREQTFLILCTNQSKKRIKWEWELFTLMKINWKHQISYVVHYSITVFLPTPPNRQPRVIIFKKSSNSSVHFSRLSCCRFVSSHVPMKAQQPVMDLLHQRRISMPVTILNSYSNQQRERDIPRI